jgi:hypothetical protein
MREAHLDYKDSLVMKLNLAKLANEICYEKRITFNKKTTRNLTTF